MANTYSQLYYHVIFAVKRRENLISEKWKTELYNQESHHQSQSFSDEYIKFLKEADINYKFEYLFEEVT